MEEGSTFQQQPAYVQKSSNKKHLITIFFVVLLLIIAGLGALYLLGKSAKHPTTPTNPVPTEVVSTPTPASSSSAQLTATPSASVSPTVDPASLSVSVLNGSGTPGAAGAVADALKNAGFTSVTTGNANAYTYKGIAISVKQAESGYTKQLQKYVQAANPNATVTVKVDNTIPTDVQVIVGK
jgi:LytR cell envelope-related transcriptional attenuator